MPVLFLSPPVAHACGQLAVQFQRSIRFERYVDNLFAPRAEYTDLGCFPDAGHPQNGRYRLARDHGCK